MSAAPAIRARGLVRRFGATTALDGFDLEVPEGVVFGLLGPNGAGKTTSTRILSTLDRADSGTAEVLGLDVAREPERVRAAIGYVPQELSADRYLTARENLELFCDLYHLGAAERRRRVGELLALVGLEAEADRLLRTFSGGMKKKLDLACGLVHRPRLLFLDEPSLGLDVHVRRAVWDHVLTLAREGTTVLLCTNYMDEADTLADRVAIVDRGRVVATGTPAELRQGLGGDVIAVELEDPAQHEPASRALRALPAVGTTWGEGAALNATVAANESALPVVIQALHAAKVKVAGVSYHRPGLEEVFLRHTGHRFAEAHASSGPPGGRTGRPA